MLLLPALKDTALPSLQLPGDITIAEGFVYFSSYGEDLVLPNLRLNGSLSLDSYPFTLLGLHGEVDVVLEITNWLGSQMPLDLSPSTMHVTVRADYPAEVTLGAGCVLTDVFVDLAVTPTPLVAGPVVTLFKLGGSFSFQLPGQAQPLLMDASVSMLSDSTDVSFSASLENWENAFGVTGLTLDLLSVDITVSDSNPFFDISASWAVDVVGDLPLTFQLEGQSGDGFTALGVVVSNFTAGQLAAVFLDITGGRLHKHL